MAEEEWEAAVRAYDELAELLGQESANELFQGASLEIHLGRGLALLKQAEFAAAGWDFHRAHVRWPGAIVPAFLHGHAYILEGRVEDAKKWFASYLRGSAFGDRKILEFLLDLKSKNHQTIISFLETMLSSEERDRALMCFLIFAGRSREALDLCQQALEESPDDALTLAFLAWIHAEIPGQAEVAKILCEKAAQQANDDARVFYTVAQAYGSLCEWENMEEWSRGALDADPDLVWAKASVADALHRQGRFSRAREFLEKSEASDPLDPSFHSLLESLRVRRFESSDAKARSEAYVETETVFCDFSITDYGDTFQDMPFEKPVSLDTVSLVGFDNFRMDWERQPAQGETDALVIEIALLSQGTPVVSATVDRPKRKGPRLPVNRQYFITVGAVDDTQVDAARLRIGLFNYTPPRVKQTLRIRGAREEDSVRVHFVHGAFQRAGLPGPHRRLTLRQEGPVLLQDGEGVSPWELVHFETPISATCLAFVAGTPPGCFWTGDPLSSYSREPQFILRDGDRVSYLPLRSEDAPRNPVFAYLDRETRRGLENQTIIGWRERVRVEGTDRVECEYNHKLWRPLEFFFAYDLTDCEGAIATEE